MEFRHFSHNHGLIFHQMPQGTTIHCSGCKSSGPGNAYICRQCNYFLHEQCFRATRSLKHPSHPLHPLTLAPYPTYTSGGLICYYCNLVGNGFSYTCSECEFDIHVHCANLHSAHTSSNPQPQNTIRSTSQVQNNAFPTHPSRNESLMSEYAKREEELLRKQYENRLHALEMRIWDESQQAILDLWDTDEEKKKKKKNGYYN